MTRLITTALFVLGVTFLAAYCSLHWWRTARFASPVWWPASGLVVAVLIRCPRRWWSVLTVAFVIGYFLANSTVNTLSESITFILGGVVEVLVASHFLQKIISDSNLRVSLRRKVVWLILAILGAIGVGMLFILISGWIFPGNFGVYSFSVGYVSSHILGMVVMAPLLMREELAHNTFWIHHMEFFLVAGLSATLSALVFLPPYTATIRSFPLLIPVMWAGIRFNTGRVAIITSITVILAASGSANSTGAFGAVANPTSRLLITQMYIAVSATAAIVLVIITRHRARLAAQASDSERTLRRAMRESQVGMYSIALDRKNFGIIQDSNAAVATMLGYSLGELDGQHCAILGARDDPIERPLLENYLHELAAGEIDGYQEESTFITAAGDKLWVQTTATSVVPEIGDPFALVQVHDLTQRENHRRQLEYLALHDSLTDLANRTLLFQRLEEALHGHRSSDSVVALLYIDLNKFKEINDRYGHHSGDVVLMEFATRLRASIRPGDTAARIGGDEFAVLCPGVGQGRNVALVAERIRTNISAPFILPGGDTITVSASIGYALSEIHSDADSLLRAADAAMYAVKNAPTDSESVG